MSDKPRSEIPLRPILARNMTARADYLVAGNPMIARPESGVGNVHPGLEFDVRALDRHFLPGLVFDFQYGAGAKLVACDPTRLTRPCDLTEADLALGLFLWAVRGRFGADPDKTQTVRLAGVDGYMVLRRIMDLEPGPLAVVVGTLPQTRAQSARLDEVVTALQAERSIAPSMRSNGSLVYALIEGMRAPYLTEDGVIDPDLIPPGEITRNLCSPWQWDFADCYCYYWASSKPDIVIGISGDAQVLNFQRDRNAREPSRPSADPQVWRAGNMSEPDIITGWEALPIVTAEREGAVPRVPRWPSIEQPMSRDEIADQLPQLAALEHALCVEYLFAKYSIRAPREAPMSIRRFALRRYQAAREVFSIAVDEMRHFRWVNEALWLLGRPPCMARAEIIGRDLRRLFQLRPLLPGTLDEFIGIEAPSSVFNDDPQQLDGMYTRILVSLHRLEGQGAGDIVRRLEQLVKVIIDEGESHWERFRRVKERLAGNKPEAYLRFLAAPGKTEVEPWRTLQALCDAYYNLLLHALYITFRLGRSSRGSWLSISHGAMFALDHAAYHLSEAGYGPLFSLPEWADRCVPDGFPEPPAGGLQAPHALAQPVRLKDVVGREDAIDALFAQVLTLIERLSGNAPARLQRVALEHRARMEKMKTLILREYEGT